MRAMIFGFEISRTEVLFGVRGAYGLGHIPVRSEGNDESIYECVAAYGLRDNLGMYVNRQFKIRLK